MFEKQEEKSCILIEYLCLEYWEIIQLYYINFYLHYLEAIQFTVTFIKKRDKYFDLHQDETPLLSVTSCLSSELLQ